MDIMKKIVVGIFLVMFLFAFVPQGQTAMWVYCNVNQAGDGFGTVYINLTASSSGWPSNQWFIAGTGNRMLATALTAINSGKLVLAYVDTYEYGTIYSMYLQD